MASSTSTSVWSSINAACSVRHAPEVIGENFFFSDTSLGGLSLSASSGGVVAAGLAAVFAGLDVEPVAFLVAFFFSFLSVIICACVCPSGLLLAISCSLLLTSDRILIF